MSFPCLCKIITSFFADFLHILLQTIFFSSSFFLYMRAIFSFYFPPLFPEVGNELACINHLVFNPRQFLYHLTYWHPVKIKTGVICQFAFLLSWKEMCRDQNLWPQSS